ncbi:hypothetical protein HanIR_Chr12g0613231 [Helianthus annuus]|nr:hypothetical protein HanIR_Chr12g0613231 [Helianthus annuus]
MTVKSGGVVVSGSLVNSRSKGVAVVGFSVLGGDVELVVIRRWGESGGGWWVSGGCGGEWWCW